MPPPTNIIDLTWLSVVKDRAGVTTSTDDDEIQDAITGFSQYILNRTGRASLNSVVSLDEIYDGNGNGRMMLRSFPITALIAVTMMGTGIPLANGSSVWGAFIDQSRKSIALRGGVGNFSSFPYPYSVNNVTSRRGPVFQRGLGNIRVQYQAGYPPTPVQNELHIIGGNTIALNFAPWAADGGVVYFPTMVPLLKVDSNPFAGEYVVTNGLYGFNNADEGAQVAVSYSYNRAPFDLEFACRCVVAINYKRKGWLDLHNRNISTSGTQASTTFQDWDWPPENELVFQLYDRKAIIT